MPMKKKIIFITILLTTLFTSVFAEVLVLERNINNEVIFYKSSEDDEIFKENGTVRMYLNEFVNAKGEKFGWATKIEGSNIFNGSFNAETGGWICYFTKGNKFYVGLLSKNGYNSTILKQGLAYEFEMEDGYGLYFMMAYATAVNDVISNSNGMLFCELYDERGYNFYITPDSELTYDVTLNTSTFTTYKKYSEFRLENGAIDGTKVYIDGEWRNIMNNPYKDKNGLYWISFYDVLGFRVQRYQSAATYANGYTERYGVREDSVIFQEYPTYFFIMYKPGYGQNFDAAKKIADNLKKHGLWKVNTPSFMGSINPGRGAYMAELITCWYRPFDDYGATEPGLDDVIKNSDGYKARQLIDYKPLTPKKVN